MHTGIGAAKQAFCVCDLGGTESPSLMERSEYDKLDRVEDQMWWFAAGHRNLLMLSQHRVSLEANDRPILDAGCGTGGFLARLATWYPDRTLLGLDSDQQACRRATAKSARPICAGSVNALPFPDGVFAVIFSADVLCHRNVDEQGALRQFRRCLAESGWLILNLPAYRWMLSGHDTAVHNTRRYTSTTLARLLKATGFRLIYSTYWNSLLFPFMVMSRKLFSPGGVRVTGGVALHPLPVDAVGRAATALETILLRAGLRFPFGGSVLAIAAKEDAADG
jgi:SAM-dependent methyltransferase